MKKYVSMIILSGVMLLSIMAVLPGVATLSTESDAPVARSTIESYVVESAHPYTNNFDYTWTITKSGATQMKVYFSKIETETNYDHLYIMDGSNSVIYDVSDQSSYLNGATTGWISGNTVKLRLDTDYSVAKYGFRVYQIEYEGESGGTSNGDMDTGVDAYDAYGASDSATLLTAPASGTGEIDISTDQYDQYRVAVDSGDEVTIEYSGPGTGIDVAIYNTDKSTIVTKSNVASFTETVTASGNGYIYFTIDADLSGDVGVYNLAVSVAGGTPADTTAPTVSISSPSNGATVSDTVTVSVSASDNVGVVGKAISIDGGAYSTSMSWDTTAVADGSHTIRARAWDAAGNYGYSTTITITVDNAPATDDGGALNDGVTASGHMNQADVSDMWYIDVSSDAESMELILTCGSADFDLYQRYNAQPTTSTYDNRGYTSGGEEVTVATPAAGRHYVMVQFYSGDSDYSLTATVTYGGGGGGDDFVLTDGVTSTGSLAAQGDTQMWTIEVNSDCTSMYSVITCGSADFDLYGRFNAEPTTSTYDWRGYTSGGEEVTFANPSAGTWYIMARSYSGSGSYDLTTTLTYGGGGGGGGSWGTGGEYAIIVGISDYQSINDLSYCDEDATDWYNFYANKGYECHVYGDGHTSNYPTYNGDATEANVRAAIQELAAHVQTGDKVVFTTSGHGASPDTDGWAYGGSSLGGTNAVSAYLCMYDCSGSTGCYYDTELAADLNLFPAGVQITVIIDHCHSGGMGPELAALSNYGNIICVTTCTGNGYGYDESSSQNGKFTYWMLRGFSSGQTTIEGAFNWLMNDGRYLPVDHIGDTPQKFDGNTGSNVTP